MKNLEQLKVLYADPRLDAPTIREQMGIGTGDEWPVALAGYVLNALNRAVNQIHGVNSCPYEPMDGDEYFPPRPPGAVAAEDASPPEDARR